MKFVMLIYQPKDSSGNQLSESEYKEVAAQYQALNSDPRVKAGLPFGFDRDAVTVRMRDGGIATAPGPNAEPPVSGYFEFEAESLEEALQLAARVPAVKLGGAVEVRPSQVYWARP